MEDWEYRIEYLAWFNLKTGQVSETDPKDKITLVYDDLGEIAKAYKNLPNMSKAVAARQLYGSDDKKVKAALSVVYKIDGEQADELVKNTRMFG